MDERHPDARSQYHETPHLADLAARGMRFPNAYAASPVCSPTRYSILLGQTPARLGKTIVRGPNRIDHAQPGLPDVLKSIDERYVCAHLGKWHVDADPETFGYDLSDGKTGNKEGGYGANRPNQRNKEWGGYPSDDPKLTPSITARAVDFLDDRAARGEPFFLQVSYYAVHSDIVYSDGAFDRAQARPPGPVHSNAGYAAMVADLDRGVGELIAALDRLGLDERTYVFFVSDNGGVPSIPPKTSRGNPHAPGLNTPLRRGKWDLTEGGIRVPFIVRGPGVEPGTQCNSLVSTIDLMPTLSDLAGRVSAVPRTADGGSFMPQLKDPTLRTVDRPLGDALVFHFPHWNMLGLGEPHSAVRQGRFKLLRFHVSERSLLFDLETDIAEECDLSGTHPETAFALESLLSGYLAGVTAESPRDSFSKKIGEDGHATTRFLDNTD